jgi:hypothetical protein
MVAASGWTAVVAVDLALFVASTTPYVVWYPCVPTIGRGGIFQGVCRGECFRWGFASVPASWVLRCVLIGTTIVKRH